MFECDVSSRARVWDLGQVQVGLVEQVRVMLGHQADHVIKHPVLLIHGDGQVWLLHHGVQPAVRTHIHTHARARTDCSKLSSFLF